MKTETETVEQKRTVYICETCGNASLNEFEISLCERNHRQGNCKHETLWYTLCPEPDYEGGFAGYHIARKCNNCGKEFVDKCIGIKDEDSIFEEMQDTLADFWEKLK